MAEEKLKACGDTFGEHSKQIQRLEIIQEHILEHQTSTSESIAILAKSMERQEVLLEKIGNLEVNTNHSFEELEEKLKNSVDDYLDKYDEVNKKFKILNPIIVMLDNKTLTFLALVGSYAMAIKELRDGMFGGAVSIFLKMFG